MEVEETEKVAVVVVCEELSDVAAALVVLWAADEADVVVEPGRSGTLVSCACAKGAASSAMKSMLAMVRRAVLAIVREGLAVPSLFFVVLSRPEGYKRCTLT